MRKLVWMMVAIAALGCVMAEAAVPFGALKNLDRKAVDASGETLLLAENAHQLPGHLLAVIQKDGLTHEMVLVTHDGVFQNIVARLKKGETAIPVDDQGNSITIPFEVRPFLIADLALRLQPEIYDVTINLGKGAKNSKPILVDAQEPHPAPMASQLPGIADQVLRDFQKFASGKMHLPLNGPRFLVYSWWDDSKKQLEVDTSAATAANPSKPVWAGRYHISADLDVLEKRFGKL